MTHTDRQRVKVTAESALSSSNHDEKHERVSFVYELCTSPATEGGRQTVAAALRQGRGCVFKINRTTRSKEQRGETKTGTEKNIGEKFKVNKFALSFFPAGWVRTTSHDNTHCSHTCGCCASSFSSSPTAEGETSNCCMPSYRVLSTNPLVDGYTQPNYTPRERKKGSNPRRHHQQPPPGTTTRRLLPRPLALPCLSHILI